MRVSFRGMWPGIRRVSAFTMIEIALCLAIIGFALVAIIGVLPFGLNVQKENRQQTIINEDAGVWMDAIRSGARGYDDLTNYVLGITNYWTKYDANTNVTGGNGPNFYDGYSYTGSRITSIPAPVDYPLTNGARIIGLLSTPQIIPFQNGGFQSNYFVAYVRAMSGDAVEKPPQDNPIILGDAFTYKMIAEVDPYVPFDPASTNYTEPGLTPQEVSSRSNNWAVVNNLQDNLHDIRLTFRWPLLPNGDLGNGFQTYRVLNGSNLTNLTDAVARQRGGGQGPPLYFFEPSMYR